MMVPQVDADQGEERATGLLQDHSHSSRPLSAALNSGFPKAEANETIAKGRGTLANTTSANAESLIRKDHIMTNKIALVTGASRSVGLGIAVAHTLAERGYHVIVAARNGAQAEEQAATLRSKGLRAEGLRLDLTNTDDFARIAEHIRTEHGHLDVLINNASTMPDRDSHSVLDVNIADVRNALDVDVVGVWALIKAMRPLLEAAPAARVVNISSIAYKQIEAGVDFPQQVMRSPAYSFAKYTLNILTATLASAFRDTGVLVNAVDPGRVATHPEFGVDDEDRPASESAAWVVWAATLPIDGPTGGIFLDGKRLA
jgi:NAD(P)-dependent dehydrogenase (short-subunit alcohol dehydrogenase family)